MSLVNRDLYPEDEYPYGQWEYMKFYEQDADKADKQIDAASDRFTKILYSKHDPASHGKPARTARVIRDDGMLGGDPSKIPDIPLSMTVLDDQLYENLLKTHKENGFFPATSYYLNHKTNKAYDNRKKNNGVLDMPYLFIDAKYDAVSLEKPSVTGSDRIDS